MEIFAFSICVDFGWLCLKTFFLFLCAAARRVACSSMKIIIQNLLFRVEKGAQCLVRVFITRNLQAAAPSKSSVLTASIEVGSGRR